MMAHDGGERDNPARQNKPEQGPGNHVGKDSAREPLRRPRCFVAPLALDCPYAVISHPDCDPVIRAKLAAMVQDWIQELRLAKASTSADVVTKLLGHQSPDATRLYFSRDQPDPPLA